MNYKIKLKAGRLMFPGGSFVPPDMSSGSPPNHPVRSWRFSPKEKEAQKGSLATANRSGWQNHSSASTSHQTGTSDNDRKCLGPKYFHPKYWHH